MYGTFDQGGNVWEWNEAVISSYRGVRGGCFLRSDGNLSASCRFNCSPTYGNSGVGFHVGEVPEPATTAIVLFGGMGMLRRRRD